MESLITIALITCSMRQAINLKDSGTCSHMASSCNCPNEIELQLSVLILKPQELPCNLDYSRSRMVTLYTA